MKRTIVLFRSESDDYQKLFQESNYETLFLEPLRFIFTNEKKLNEKLTQNNYDGLILTSPKAIEAISKCWDSTKTDLWRNKKIYTVGDASGEKIKTILKLQPLGMSSGNAENLANIISNENGTSSFLFPCGNLRSESIITSLQSKSMTVDSLIVYETQENEALKAHLTELSESSSSPCGLVFFSPSGCEYVHRQLQTFNNKLLHLPHFAIGNTTAHKFENLGIEISGVASRPTPHHILEVVNRYFTDNHH